MWPFTKKIVPKTEPERLVALVNFQGKTKIVPVVLTQSGYMANWWNLNDTWCLLNGDGSVSNSFSNIVVKWYKIRGWEENNNESN